MTVSSVNSVRAETLGFVARPAGYESGGYEGGTEDADPEAELGRDVAD
jgi:hypothetical protein